MVQKTPLADSKDMSTKDGRNGQDAPDEDRLWEAYRYWGDNDARDKLVALYQPLLRPIVAKERAYALSIGAKTTDFDELLSIAQEGLLIAIKNFDPNRGVQFSTYGWRRISGRIRDALRSDDYLTRRQRQNMKAWLNGEDIPERQARDSARMASQRPTDATIDEIIRIPDNGRIEDTIVDLSYVGEAIKSLSPMEKAVLRYRYHDNMTMSAIGVLLQVTESRISQVHRETLRRLRQGGRVD